MAFEETARVQIAISWQGSPLAYRFDKPFRLEADRLKVASFSSTVSSTGSGADEITTKVFNYVLAPTQPGLATINATAIEYVSWPDSIAGELLTDPMTISIAQPAPVEAPGGGLSAGMLLAVAAVVLAAAGAAVYVVRRRKPGEVILTPAERFLEELAGLRSEAGNDLKKFQTGLYKHLVTYLSDRYQLELGGKTTEAIVAELGECSLSGGAKETFTNWLMRAEKEKFSPVAATPGEAIRLESEVREFFAKMQ